MATAKFVVGQLVNLTWTGERGRVVAVNPNAPDWYTVDFAEFDNGAADAQCMGRDLEAVDPAKHAAQASLLASMIAQAGE